MPGIADNIVKNIVTDQTETEKFYADQEEENKKKIQSEAIRRLMNGGEGDPSFDMGKQLAQLDMTPYQQLSIASDLTKLQKPQVTKSKKLVPAKDVYGEGYQGMVELGVENVDGQEKITDYGTPILPPKPKEPEEVSTEYFEDATKIPGLESYKDHVVKVKKTTKGDKIEYSYGQPVSNERKKGKIGDSEFEFENLSAAEKEMLKGMEKKRVENQTALDVAKQYGSVDVVTTDEFGTKIQNTYTYNEMNQIATKEKRMNIERLKNIIGEKYLAPYDETYNKFRQGGKDVKNLSDTEFASMVDELGTQIYNLYENDELPESALEAYEQLFQEEFGFSLTDVWRENNATSR